MGKARWSSLVSNLKSMKGGLSEGMFVPPTFDALNAGLGRSKIKLYE
jgi:hypothetical protein